MSWHIAHVADSFSELAAAASGSVDVTIADPPYDAHCHENQSSGTALKAQIESGKSGGIPRITPAFDPLAGYGFLADLVHVSRRWAVSFATVEAFGEARRVCGDAYVRGGIWYKPNSMGQLTGDRPATAYEGVICLHRPGKKHWNGRGSYGLWACNGTRGEKDRHPNQKPLALCLKLVALFSDRGETVFDPFCGSGRIGEAALLLGRHFVGLERDPEWVLKASGRLSSVAFGSVSDEQALALCTAKRSEMLDEP